MKEYEQGQKIIVKNGNKDMKAIVEEVLQDDLIVSVVDQLTFKMIKISVSKLDVVRS